MSDTGGAPWGTGRAARGDELTQHPSSAAFSPPFQQEQGRQGKGKQLRHQLQLHLPTGSALCQPLAPLLPSANCSAPSFQHNLQFLQLIQYFLFWVHELVVETLSLNFSLGACGITGSVKCSLFPYKEGFEKFSLMCVTDSFIRTYL